MKPTEFQIYTARFEIEVLMRGLEMERWGTWKDVTVRRGKLAPQPIGKLVGTRFVYPKPAAIDYYGFVKKSLAFMALAVELPMEARTLFAPVVSVSTPSTTAVGELAPELLDGFAAWKDHIYRVRYKGGG